MPKLGNQNAASWTEEHVGTLKRLWADGLSCSQIAAEMGQGFTRNAVIGKVTRLKLPKRTQTLAKSQRSALGRVGRTAVKPIRPAPIVRRASAPHAQPPQPIPEDETDVGVDVTKRIGLLALNERTCRWPVGPETGAKQMFCGCRKGRDAGPYCLEHARKAENRR